MPSIFTRKSLNRIILLYVCCGGLVLVTSLLGLFYSSVTIPMKDIVHILLEKSVGLGLGLEIEKQVAMIIWEIRLPRVILAGIVGASLALAGAAFQGLLRNPLADPYTIGVSSGAALGAVAVIFFQITLVGLQGFTLPLFSIAGGFFTLLLVYSLTRLSGRGMAVQTIILAGIIISSFVGAFISLIIALSGTELRQIIYWIMGSVGMRGWSYVGLVLPFFLLGAIVIIWHYRELNTLALGEEAARHVGVNVNRKKIYILIGASLLTGGAVAVSGMIGFVGLVVPHLVRLVIGPNHKHVLPLSVLVGSSFLILADLLSRTIIAPQELPIGVITALIGAPVFAYLLIRNRSGRRVRM
ncbi:FecCD family ABC transporter permease [Bacillus horti]|uniref:FecCD family ABC transporter permease n=1 Tax=Caldalkalibacillus horti TaxID=77523 RepID=UPI0027D90C4C|nr:iron ABC transporter permease [Bacillus horti]